MLTIGILGEYLSSIFNEIKGRPEFIIDDVVNIKPDSSTKPEKLDSPTALVSPKAIPSSLLSNS